MPYTHKLDMKKYFKLNFIDNTVAIRINTKTSNTIGMIIQTNFHSNKQYHVQLDDHPSNGAGDVNLTNLYWGSTNVTEIRSKVRDIYQDASISLATVEPFATNPFPNWDWTPPNEFLGVPLLNETTFRTSIPTPILDEQSTITDFPSQKSTTMAPILRSSSTIFPAPTTPLLSSVRQHDDNVILECTCSREHLVLFLSVMLNIFLVCFHVVGVLKKQTRIGKETLKCDDNKEEKASLIP